MDIKRICCWLSVCSFLVGICHAEDATRPFADGPLSVEDFRGTVPDDEKILDAVVFTRMSYQFKYSFRKTKNGVTIICDQIICSGQQIPNRSWIRNPCPALLEHEQGHFDLAELMAKKAQSRLRFLARNQKLVGRGADPEEAEKALRVMVRAQLAPFDRELTQENNRYDKDTEHGRNKKAQQEARREQKRKLRELSKRSMPTIR